jgi:DNA-binding response OmpR family regulator
MAKILIVEDDPLISRNVGARLESENHTVDVVADGDDGLYRLLNYSYDLAILDWQLPGMQGAEICEAVRAAKKTTPILMLTSRSSLSDRVRGLDSGAYDYMVKPCSLSELAARVRSLLRRPGNESISTIYVGNVQINLESHEVLVDGARLQLSPSEFLILQLLCQNRDKALTSDLILSKLWGDKPNVSKQLIKVHITHLRKKLAAGAAALQINSQKGGGYMVEPVDEEAEADILEPG